MWSSKFLTSLKAFAAVIILPLCVTMASPNAAMACPTGDFHACNMEQQRRHTEDASRNAYENAAREQDAAEQARRAQQTNLPARPAAHSAIARHPSASDVWVAAMYPSRGSAMNAAVERCNFAMGGGCEATWQGRGFIGAARSPNGHVFWATGSRQEVKKYFDDACAVYELGCTQLGVFHSESEFRRNRSRTGPNIREPQASPTLRKRFAAVAWLDGDAYNRMSWIASGYATVKQAEDVALSACQLRVENSSPCKVAISTGNGTLISFVTDKKGDRFIVEQSEERARQAVALFCRRESLRCTDLRVFDARVSGVFENAAS